ncbi:MAG: transposase, partial [Verrucomicrobia bacterium]|nr:transposase [Verrucomicrobiota bacterium]
MRQGHPERFLAPFRWKWIGAKPKDRLALANAFIAKSIWNFPTTRALLDYLENAPSLRRLCGWETVSEIPSESTFSRAFAAFAAHHLPEQIHAAMIQENCGPKLAGHVSRDATAIPAREKPIRKPAPEPQVPKKRGRPSKDQPAPPKELRRLEIQPQRSLAENLADLPTGCDHGTKRNSQGFKDSWIGYKLHMDVIDGDIPVSAILTSASLHDSQAAIPLAQITHQRIL